MTQTTISLEETLLDDVKVLASEEDRSVSNYIVKSLRKIVEAEMTLKGKR